MKRVLLMIAVVALVGCGKKEPVQPSATKTEATKPEKERGKEATQPTKPEPPKAKAVAGVKLWEFETRGEVWADRLPPCFGICPARGGVIVVCAPDIVFLAARDGDGKAEMREKLFTGFTEVILEQAWREA